MKLFLLKPLVPTSKLFLWSSFYQPKKICNGFPYLCLCFWVKSLARYSHNCLCTLKIITAWNIIYFNHMLFACQRCTRRKVLKDFKFCFQQHILSLLCNHLHGPSHLLQLRIFTATATNIQSLASSTYWKYARLQLLLSIRGPRTPQNPIANPSITTRQNHNFSYLSSSESWSTLLVLVGIWCSSSSPGQFFGSGAPQSSELPVKLVESKGCTS